MRASDKRRLLEQLSMEAATGAGLDAGEVVRGIAKREELGSTGVGSGVTLLHARFQGIKALQTARAPPPRHRLDAIDGEPMDVVFLLLIIESADGPNRNVLACVARALRETEILRQLRHAPEGEALFRAITGPATA
jgi:nitrogen PTS system EIIA component